MAFLTKKEFATRCGISTKTLSTYRKRNKIIYSGEFIDDSNPVNKEFIEYRQEKRTVHPNNAAIDLWDIYDSIIFTIDCIDKTQEMNIEIYKTQEMEIGIYMNEQSELGKPIHILPVELIGPGLLAAITEALHFGMQLKKSRRNEQVNLRDTIRNKMIGIFSDAKNHLLTLSQEISDDQRGNN